MSQRNSEYDRIERDLYETPAWVTEALLPHLRPASAIWEPAAGSGQMARVLQRHGSIAATDIYPDPCLNGVCDFLKYTSAGAYTGIVTNPPYELAREFCEHALRLMEPAGGFVVMLLRTDFDHAKSRAHLFADCPAFAKKIILRKRIAWFVEVNGKPKASPSFNHAWYLWDWKHDGAATLAYAA